MNWLEKILIKNSYSYSMFWLIYEGTYYLTTLFIFFVP